MCDSIKSLQGLYLSLCWNDFQVRYKEGDCIAGCGEIYGENEECACSETLRQRRAATFSSRHITYSGHEWESQALDAFSWAKAIGQKLFSVTFLSPWFYVFFHYCAKFLARLLLMCIFEKGIAITILNHKSNFKLESNKIDLLPGNHIFKKRSNELSTTSHGRNFK